MNSSKVNLIHYIAFFNLRWKTKSKILCFLESLSRIQMLSYVTRYMVISKYVSNTRLHNNILKHGPRFTNICDMVNYQEKQSKEQVLIYYGRNLCERC